VPGDRAEGGQEEHFLVDGIAPAVIGGGPPESPFDVEPDPEPPHAGRGRSRSAGEHFSGNQYHEPAYQQEPPTSPIPVIRPQQQQQPEQQKRRSLFAKMFRSPES
jgi:hypothetical protein